jgi:hypothetical protein
MNAPKPDAVPLFPADDITLTLCEGRALETKKSADVMSALYEK